MYTPLYYILCIGGMVMHIASLKCWMGSIPMVVRNDEDHPDGYCVHVKYKGIPWLYYNHTPSAEFKSLCSNNSCDIFESCQTDYCNTPPNPPPLFKLKSDAETQPSEAPIRCWESTVFNTTIKSTTSFGRGFCAKFTIFYTGGRQIVYGYVNGPSNDFYSEGKADTVSAYYSCNTDYCNDPNVPTNTTSSLRCWMGQEPAVYRSLEDSPSNGYCAKIQKSKDSQLYYDYVTEQEFQTLGWNSSITLFETCATDYCNEPPDPPLPFIPRITAARNPSSVNIKCWETLNLDSDSFKNMNQPPKKSALAKGIGFCAIIVYVHRQGPKVRYGYVTPEWNAYLSTGRVGNVLEYYSCNKFYCNDPLDPALPGMQNL